MELNPIDVIRLRALGVREEASSDEELRRRQAEATATFHAHRAHKAIQALARAERARTVWMLATASGWLAAIGAVVWGWR